MGECSRNELSSSPAPVTVEPLVSTPLTRTFYFGRSTVGWVPTPKPKRKRKWKPKKKPRPGPWTPAEGYWTNEGRLTHQIKCMTTEQIHTVVVMSQEGKTQEEIAQEMGVNQASISRILARFKDTRGMAKSRLNGTAYTMVKRLLQAAEKAAEKGDATAALEVLDRLDVMPKKQPAPMSGKGETKVLVVVGAPPGSAASRAALEGLGFLTPEMPAIDVTSTPVLSE
jgi:DNA-binding MarR family transcriptional regulator